MIGLNELRSMQTNSDGSNKIMMCDFIGVHNLIKMYFKSIENHCCTCWKPRYTCWNIDILCSDRRAGPSVATVLKCIAFLLIYSEFRCAGFSHYPDGSASIVACIHAIIIWRIDVCSFTKCMPQAEYISTTQRMSAVPCKTILQLTLSPPPPPLFHATLLDCEHSKLNSVGFVISTDLSVMSMALALLYIQSTMFK